MTFRPQDIFQIRVVRGDGDLSCPVKILLPGEENPEPRDAGTIYIQLDYPEPSERYTALGRYIDQWGILEILLLQLAHGLIGSDQATAQTITATLGTKSTTDLIRNLAALKLTKDDCVRLNSLMDRVGKSGTKRNYIVHGRWLYEAFVFVTGDGTVNCRTQFLREYEPADQKLQSMIADPANQKERVKYSFTLKRLILAANDLIVLQTDLAEFIRAAGVSRADPVPPRARVLGRG